MQLTDYLTLKLQGLSDVQILKKNDIPNLKALTIAKRIWGIDNLNHLDEHKAKKLMEHHIEQAEAYKMALMRVQVDRIRMIHDAGTTNRP